MNAPDEGFEEFPDSDSDFENIPLDSPPYQRQNSKNEGEYEDEANAIYAIPTTTAHINLDGSSFIPHSQPINIVPVVTKTSKPKQPPTRSHSPSSVISELTLLIKPQYLAILDTLTPHSPVIVLQSATRECTEYLRKKACCFTIEQLSRLDASFVALAGSSSLESMAQDAKVLAHLLPWKKERPTQPMTSMPNIVRHQHILRKVLHSDFAIEDISTHSSIAVLKGMSAQDEAILFSCQVNTLKALAKLKEYRFDFERLKVRLSKPILNRHIRKAKKLIAFLEQHNSIRRQGFTRGLGADTIQHPKRFLGQKLQPIPGEVFQHNDKHTTFAENKAYVPPVTHAAEPSLPHSQQPQHAQVHQPQQSNFEISRFTFIDDPALAILIKEGIPKETITSDSSISVINGVDDNTVQYLAKHDPPVCTIRQLAKLHAEDASFYEGCKGVINIDDIVIKAETLCCVLDEDYVYMPSDDTDDMPDLIPPARDEPDTAPLRYFTDPDDKGKEKESEWEI